MCWDSLHLHAKATFTMKGIIGKRQILKILTGQTGIKKGQLHVYDMLQLFRNLELQII